ncbi:MAG: Protease HtpX-like protein [Candidatus Wolfebacteria bacterium GW2011_GWC1_43_10]|uniref:Protease HtpX homolog n=2 Tax=Candidatus Wolfeibacteriota TaxID=1752735 RepID=A0A0G1CAN6_9BACT|nr:MAG: Protease HtpX-like protein [Candidatus Wolfebacteria bacterium GW2011_GWC1_43_10]KKT22925.1 MAG: Protease HtpX-like protein [Parcubacteria group bacterium GW2011_GWB1_43_8b]OGM89962.1 MAG: zinc metalloprotease HtpX [Candidatus Wolfebacteria bacterium GWA1_42_9]
MNLYSFRDSNIRKTWIIFSLFLIVIIGLGWFFSYAYQDRAILYFAVIFSVLVNFLAYWKSDKIALTISGARKADPQHFVEIYRIVENLSITAGTPAPQIYIIEDVSPNAFATGRNPKNSSIALTTGLIEQLNRSEIEGVVSHELSHIKNYDILLSTVVVVLVGIIALLSDFFVRFSWMGRGRGSDRGKNPVIMIIGIASIILAPIIGTLIQLAISRKREFLADASGVLLTRYPEGLASALEKISVAPAMRKPHNATAHLFIASPFKADSGQKKIPWMVRLFSTHPPIEERIKILREM